MQLTSIHSDGHTVCVSPLKHVALKGMVHLLTPVDIIIHIFLYITVGGLDSLCSLHTLILSHNQLITTKLLSEAPAIQVLDVAHNHLPVLDSIGRLPLLQSLDARDNNLLSVSIHSHDYCMCNCKWDCLMHRVKYFHFGSVYISAFALRTRNVS